MRMCHDMRLSTNPPLFKFILTSPKLIVYPKARTFPMPLGRMIIPFRGCDRAVIEGSLDIFTSYTSFEGLCNKCCSGRVGRNAIRQACDASVFHEEMIEHLSCERSASVVSSLNRLKKGRGRVCAVARGIKIFLNGNLAFWVDRDRAGFSTFHRHLQNPVATIHAKVFDPQRAGL